MPEIARHGSRLIYDDCGTGDPPLLLVHGLGNHTAFARQSEHFRRSHRVVAPDLPGFGRSERRGTACAIADQAEHLTWLCHALHLRGPVIIGHSMGGAIAVEIAAGEPELPSAVVLVDPLPLFPLPQLQGQRVDLQAEIGGPHYREAVRRFCETRMFRPGDDPEVRARLVDDMCAASQDVLVPTFASITRWNAERLAHRMRCPVLLITAGDGLPSDMERTRLQISRLEVRSVDASHFVHVFAADEVDALITEFLATLP